MKYLRFGQAYFEHMGYLCGGGQDREFELCSVFGSTVCAVYVILGKPHNLAELLPHLENALPHLSMHLTGLLLGKPVKFLMG